MSDVLDWHLKAQQKHLKKQICCPQHNQKYDSYPKQAITTHKVIRSPEDPFILQDRPTYFQQGGKEGYRGEAEIKQNSLDFNFKKDKKQQFVRQIQRQSIFEQNSNYSVDCLILSE